ncbi:MAG: LPS export ABC transporter periplasmic protein LptC [Anaerolineae bacterium]|nr:LPS export ABC transporter periplasmic protein LptC [Anaerolineae bacterium]
MAVVLKKRRLTLWIVLLLVVMGIWLQRQEEQPFIQPQEEAEQVMDYSLTDFEITSMNSDGQVKHRLAGTRMPHYAENDYAELTQPYMEIYRATGNVMTVDSKLAKVYQGGDSVFLEGDVNMLNQPLDGQNKTEVRTRDLWYYADREFAETGAPVTITNNNGMTAGVGMKVYTKDNVVELLANVRGKYVPK